MIAIVFVLLVLFFKGKFVRMFCVHIAHAVYVGENQEYCSKKGKKFIFLHKTINDQTIIRPWCAFVNIKLKPEEKYHAYLSAFVQGCKQ